MLKGRVLIGKIGVKLIGTAKYTLFYRNVVFPAQAEYSFFSADFRLKIFLHYS